MRGPLAERALIPRQPFLLFFCPLPSELLTVYSSIQTEPPPGSSSAPEHQQRRRTDHTGACFKGEATQAPTGTEVQHRGYENTPELFRDLTGTSGSTGNNSCLQLALSY